MFAVIFEVQPKPERWDEYLERAKLLRPELVQIDGFIDNIRYGSKRFPGRLLSLSIWRDEKSVVRWRTHALHHETQAKGRFEIFEDYHLRIGEITADTHVPPGHAIREQRLDETEIGTAKALTFTELQHPADLPPDASAETIAARLDAPVAGEWDVFEAILSPGDLVVLHAGSEQASVPSGARQRRVRVVRDYGMFDRREAPQYFPPVPR